MEGNEDSEDGLDDDDDEEFIPNVGLVSTRHKNADSDQEGGKKALISLEENITKLEQSILANSPHVTFAGTKNGSSSNGGNLRGRSSSVTSETANDTTFFQKRKKTFNFSNVKKR